MISALASRWLRDALGRVIDGPAPWGAVTVSADRLGLMRYRLVIYPPGITAAGRRWLRAWRGWPLWGLLLWLTCHLITSHLIGPWPALALATALAVVSGVAVYMLAGDARADVRTLSVVMLAGDAEPGTQAAHRRLDALARVLVGADKLAVRGQLSAVEYERIWWQVYDLLDADEERPTGTGRKVIR